MGDSCEDWSSQHLCDSLGSLWWADLRSVCRKDERHQDVVLTTPGFLLWLAIISEDESNKCGF